MRANKENPHNFLCFNQKKCKKIDKSISQFKKFLYLCDMKKAPEAATPEAVKKVKQIYRIKKT